MAAARVATAGGDEAMQQWEAARVASDEAAAARRHVQPAGSVGRRRRQLPAVQALISPGELQRCHYGGTRCAGCGVFFARGERVCAAGGGLAHPGSGCAREAEQQVGRRQLAAQTDRSLGAARAYATWTRLEREFALGASQARRLLLPRHSRERFIEMVEWMGHDEGRRALLPQVQRAVGLHTAQTGSTDWSADEGVRRRLDALRRGEVATEGR